MGQIKSIQVGSHKIRYVMNRVLPVRSIYITNQDAIFLGPLGQPALAHGNCRRLVVQPIFRWGLSKRPTTLQENSPAI